MGQLLYAYWPSAHSWPEDEQIAQKFHHYSCWFNYHLPIALLIKYRNYFKLIPRVKYDFLS